MSISVKNIAFSINGTTSNQFNIDLDGAKYSLSKFKMTQKLLEPCKLEFTLRKAPQEDISEIQFTTCGSIIGKDVQLTLQTDSMEQEIQGFSEGSQNADIDFVGIVTSAKATRKESEYAIEVVAETKDVVLKNAPCYDFHNEKTLADIVNYITKEIKDKNGEVKVDPELTKPIFFTAQYNETDYEFLQRLAQRHGEWMFNNGKEFHFGKLDKQDQITLAYPSRDLPEYSARLQMFHVKHTFLTYSYDGLLASCTDFGDNQEETGNKLNDLTFKASYDMADYYSAEDVVSHSIEGEDADLGKPNGDNYNMGAGYFEEPSKAFKNGRRANMLVYEGKSYCSKMKIGAKLTIKDNYISSGSSEQKSEVQQDEILITEVIHDFNVDQQYSNEFKGITAAITFPPYLDPTIYPVCQHTVRAIVKDNEDPKHRGRVRVRMIIPSDRNIKRNNSNLEDPNTWTPWIHVVQPYSGGGVSGDTPDMIYGTHLLPEKLSQVYVDFEGGNFERPYVIGTYTEHHLASDDPKWYIGNNNVKAIRTVSGHTIEIHDVQDDKDFGKGGFIKIYDNHTHDYEVLLSSDRNLIKLKSVGNIELEAGEDIIINAGGNIDMTAQKDISAWAMEKMSLHSEKEFQADTRNTMKLSSHLDMTLHSEADWTAESDKNMYLTSHKYRKDYVEGAMDIKTTDMYHVDCKDHVFFELKKVFEVASETAEFTSKKSFQVYAQTINTNAKGKTNFTSTISIDLNAPTINES